MANFPRKYFPRSSAVKNCEIDINFDKPFYCGGEEVKASVTLRILKNLSNISKVYWEISGSEYVSWEVLTNNVHTLYSNGKKPFTGKSTIYGVKKEMVDFKEGEEHTWEAKYVLPHNLAPSFKTGIARIDYYFRVVVEQTNPTSTTTFHAVKYFSVVKPFDKEDVFENEKNLVFLEGEGKAPSPSFKRRILGEESTSSTVEVKAQTTKNIYCALNDENPSLPLKLSITSKATTPVNEYRVGIARKTTAKVKSSSNVDRRVVFSKTYPLDPPLAPSETRDIDTIIEIPQNLLPSVETEMIENTYIFNVQVKLLVLKSFVNFTNAPKDYEPVIVEVSDETKTGIETSLMTQLKTASPSPSQWTAKEVASYLAVRGLADYKRVLQKNKIDGEALLQLEEKHFGDLGITKLGDIVKLKKLIEELKMKEQLMVIGEQVEDVEPIESVRFDMKNHQLIKQSLRSYALSSLAGK